MIQIREVVKRYRETLALDRLTLEIPEGSVFGLLGPNGAGKTTLLRLLMGFIFVDSGEIDRGGLSTARIGYLPERAFYPPLFQISDYLTTIGRLAGLPSHAVRPAVAERLSQVGLAEAAGRRLGACSRGMLQRVGLAQAMLGDPSLLLLDEPALGLDPAGQKFMREQILALQRAGKTVILSSHHLDEVIRVCSHVAVISEGHLVRSGALESILIPRAEVTILTSPLPPALPEALASLAPGIVVDEGRIVLAGAAAGHKAGVLRLLLEEGVDIRQLSEEQVTLEEIYLEATGE
jgi:ABC-2 type transport system ATP-binding protein